MIGYKRSKNFKGYQTNIEDEITGKIKVETDCYFTGVVNYFVISKDIQQEIFLQLSAAGYFLSSYLEHIYLIFFKNQLLNLWLVLTKSCGSYKRQKKERSSFHGINF